jgi:hypothetical protein
MLVSKLHIITYKTMHYFMGYYSFITRIFIGFFSIVILCAK